MSAGGMAPQLGGCRTVDRVVGEGRKGFQPRHGWCVARATQLNNLNAGRRGL